MTTPWRRRREARLARLEAFRRARRVVDEDVTVLGEQLSELHLDTLTDTLDPAAREDYRHALERYESAGTMLRAAEAAEDLDAVLAVDRVLVEARFHRACVLARVAGEPLPVRREPCFFNPQHLPSVADVAWTPPLGTEREVAVCPACRERLAGGATPDVRMVRAGDRWVPWWEGGPEDRLGRHHAHLVSGTSWQTDVLVAEAQARAAAGGGAGAGGLGW